MAIKVQYADANNSKLRVTLASGDTIGNMVGPIAFEVFTPSQGNAEHDAVFKLVHAGKMMIAPYEAPAAAAGTGRTYKADIWRRATDAEAAVIIQDLDALPIRTRRIFDDATYLDHSDVMFADLTAGFVHRFGAERAAVLLAPSA